MTSPDLSASGEALDYRGTVAVLVEALAMTQGAVDHPDLAEQMTAHLARAGLVLVQLEQVPGLAREGHEAVSDWFGREEDR